MFRRQLCQDAQLLTACEVSMDVATLRIKISGMREYDGQRILLMRVASELDTTTANRHAGIILARNKRVRT